MRAIESASAIGIGEFTVHSLDDGELRLDGGAIFGVVPKTVWERTSPADEANRVRVGLHPLLVEGAGRRILVETGLGGRHDAVFAERFAVDRDLTLDESLRRLAVRDDEIDFVVNSHLHWDHAGGNFRPDGAEAAIPSFPSARYVVQKVEWEDASSPHERNRASYRPVDFAALGSDGRLLLVTGDAELAEGVRLERVGGHCRGLQIVRVTSRGETLVFLSDLVPSVAHLEYAWVMGYDLYPVETLARKKELLRRAAQEGWILAFYHDPVHRFGRVRIESHRGRERLRFEPLGE